MGRMRAVYAAALASFALAACSDGLTDARTPAKPAADETNGTLSISCPYHTLMVGESMDCTTTNSGVNVTSSTNFYPMYTTVASASSTTPGRITGVANGGTLIFGSYNGVLVSWDLTVATPSLSITANYNAVTTTTLVTWTATPSPSGSYYYVWEKRWCYDGSAPGDCDGLWHYVSEGQDATTRTANAYANDFWVELRAKIKRSSTGAVLATSPAYRVTGGHGQGDCYGIGC